VVRFELQKVLQNRGVHCSPSHTLCWNNWWAYWSWGLFESRRVPPRYR